MSYLRKKYKISSDSESDQNSDSDIDLQINDIISTIPTKTKINNNIIINKKNPPTNLIKKEILDETLLKDYNSLLKKYWGYDSLKPIQFDIIKKIIIDGSDVCAILATGFGKSICYQLPFLITNKSVIVISPLIALMHEQGQEMRKRNIPVAVFNSDSSSKIKQDEKSEIMNGTNKLIFMTPEYFVKSETFIKNLEDEILMVCIDEAHAVSTWGLDFRPSYTKLGVIREWIPSIPILTLTATASTKVCEDINKILNLSDPKLVIGNFDRPNLLIKVEQRHDDINQKIELLLNKYLNEYVIIYCKTRDETDLLAEKIKNIGISCESYHAGMNDKLRTKVQQDFIDGKIKCIIATIAFGMGINIPNVRLVIHYNCPKNLESYYQEIGRAGRDGLPSECVLFYSSKDFKVNRYFLQSIENPVQKVYQENQIRQIEKYVGSYDCRRKLILENFGQILNSCKNCDNCLKNISTNFAEVKKEDFTKQVYLIMCLMNKINDKFGMGMFINILLAKTAKIKSWMKEYNEFGSGTSFGNEDWWKNLFRLMINDDLLIETQIKGTFGSTIGLTEKGTNLKNKLLINYTNYLDLLKDSLNEDTKTYKNNKIMYPEINIKKINKNKINKNNFIKNL